MAEGRTWRCESVDIQEGYGRGSGRCRVVRGRSGIPTRAPEPTGVRKDHRVEKEDDNGVGVEDKV